MDALMDVAAEEPGLGSDPKATDDAVPTLAASPMSNTDEAGNCHLETECLVSKELRDTDLEENSDGARLPQLSPPSAIPIPCSSDAAISFKRQLTPDDDHQDYSSAVSGVSGADDADCHLETESAVPTELGDIGPVENSSCNPYLPPISPTASTSMTPHFQASVEAKPIDDAMVDTVTFDDIVSYLSSVTPIAHGFGVVNVPENSWNNLSNDASAAGLVYNDASSSLVELDLVSSEPCQITSETSNLETEVVVDVQQEENFETFHESEKSMESDIAEIASQTKPDIRLRKRSNEPSYREYHETSADFSFESSDNYQPSDSNYESTTDEPSVEERNDTQAAPFRKERKEFSETENNEGKIEETLQSGRETNQNEEVSGKTQSNHNNDRAISVASLQGKRTWDKTFLCFFCRKSFAKLPRHWYRTHSDEPEVAKIMSLKMGCEERNNLIDILRNKGVFSFNSNQIREGEGSIVPKRRPPQSKQKKVEDYVPCQFCRQLFSKSHIAVHQNRCKLKTVPTEDMKQRNRGIRAANMLMLPVGPETSEKFKEHILSKMKGDDIYMAIRKDSIILQYGQHEYSRLGHEERYHRTIIDRCRELGRLILAAKELDPNVTSLNMLLKASRYQLLKNATRKVAGFQESTGTFQIPSLVLKLGISIKKCANVLKGDYLQDEILSQNVPDIDKFLQVMISKWTADMSSKALRTLNENKWNAPKRLPMAKDIQTLTKYLALRSEFPVQELKNNPDTDVYSELCEITLVQVLTLNRKRVGEVQFMRRSEYDKAQSADENADVFYTLSEAEKELSKRLLRLTIKGKKGRGVPVLLTENIQSQISILLDLRSTCGVNSSNDFLFPSLVSTSGYFRAHESLKKFAIAAKCDQPQFITSTKLRKHVATMTQLLNLREHELDAVAKFMGHDIRVHRQFYRLADETMDLAKVSKLLLSMEKGNLDSMKGKTLDDIDVADDHVSEEEDCPDDIPWATDQEAGASGLQKSNKSSSSSIPCSSKKSVPIEAFSSNESSSDEDDQPVAKKKKMISGTNKQERKKCEKRPWSVEESGLIRRHFSNFVASLIVPKKDDIENFLKSHPGKFTSRTWRNVKDYVYNLIKNKKKLDQKNC